jgi:hypothetical protein
MKNINQEVDVTGETIVALVEAVKQIQERLDVLEDDVKFAYEAKWTIQHFDMSQRRAK